MSEKVALISIIDIQLNVMSGGISNEYQYVQFDSCSIDTKNYAFASRFVAESQDISSSNCSPKFPCDSRPDEQVRNLLIIFVDSHIRSGETVETLLCRLVVFAPRLKALPKVCPVVDGGRGAHNSSTTFCNIRLNHEQSYFYISCTGLRLFLVDTSSPEAFTFGFYVIYKGAGHINNPSVQLLPQRCV